MTTPTQPQRDWGSFDRKISRGVPLRQAMVACGIPEDEVLKRLSTQTPKPAEISYELKMMAERVLRVGMEKLVEIAKAGPRYSDELATVSNADLIAAQTLAKLGIEVLKMSVAQNPEASSLQKRGTVQFDLFDGPGAWSLKTPGSD